MFARAATLALCAMVMAAPAAAQQNNAGFAGRVDQAPLPATRGQTPVRPVPDEQVFDPAAPARPSGTETVAQPTFSPQPATPEPATSIGESRIVVQTLPALPRADEAEGTGTEATAAGDGTLRQTEAGQFLRAPFTTGDDPAEAPVETALAPVEEGEDDGTGRFKRAPETAYNPDADIAPVYTPPTDLRRGARLRQLDKMTGVTQTVDIRVGETLQIDRLRIRLDACRAPEDNDTHGTMAFLKIWDTKHAEAPEAFTGWMFAESPAISALDHPRYDLWVISCTTSSAVTSAANE